MIQRTSARVRPRREASYAVVGTSQPSSSSAPLHSASSHERAARQPRVYSHTHSLELDTHGRTRGQWQLQGSDQVSQAHSDWLGALQGPREHTETYQQ